MILMAGAVLPALLLGAALTALGKRIAPETFANKAVSAFFFQAVFYLVTLGALYAVVVIKHRRPFWCSLGWTLGFRGAWLCVLSAPFLMIAISMLGEAMRAPIVPSPWEDLISGKASQLTVLLFAALLGPFWEELLFRGFLYPLIERFAGPWGAILGAAIPFGLIHGAQNQWVWQYVVLVALSGVAFGFARYKTGSTVASTLMHSAYNSFLFIVFLIQRL